jgi:recombination protein RecA
MPSATAIRLQVESALSKRVPAALTPIQRQTRPVQPVGIAAVDALVGGFPIGAITELTGPESSGRTSLALAFLARVTRRAGVCAWIDASDTLDNESAAAAGVDFARLLWVRCGVRVGDRRPKFSFEVPERYMVPRAPKRGLHGGGFGPHPRTETKGLSQAIGKLFPHAQVATASTIPRGAGRSQPVPSTPRPSGKLWGRIEQALKATDLILHAGGFAAVVLDLAGIAPEHVSRVELSTWFRYRAAVERGQSSLVLLTKHPSAKSAGELLLRLNSGEARLDEATVFTGVEHEIEVERQRFAGNLVSFKKPPQSMCTAWTTRPTWAVRR